MFAFLIIWSNGYKMVSFKTRIAAVHLSFLNKRETSYLSPFRPVLLELIVVF